MSKKITLLKAAQVPLNGPIRPSGFTAEVDEETYQSLHDRGLLADEPDQTEDGPAAEQSVDTAPEQAEDAVDPVKPVVRKFPPLPKKTEGANVWREYARENEIDVRGLSEKAALIGHITQVVNDQ